MLAAVLDTCVLFNGLTRDLLLSLVAFDSYRLVLTESNIEEIEDVETRKLMKQGHDRAVAERRAAFLASQLRESFEVVCQSRSTLVAPVGLPDPDDEHLVAAAVAGGAEVIVTANFTDLPDRLLPSGIRTQDAPSFLHDMICADPDKAAMALLAMSERRRKPPQSELDILGLLVLKGQLRSTTADILRSALSRMREDDR